MASCPIHRYTLAHLVVTWCRKFGYVNSQYTCRTCQQHTLSLTCAAASWRLRHMSLSTWRAWSASCLTTSRMPVRTSGFSRLLCTWKISPQACTKSSCTAARVRASPSRLAPAPDDKLHCTQPQGCCCHVLVRSKGLLLQQSCGVLRKLYFASASLLIQSKLSTKP